MTAYAHRALPHACLLPLQTILGKLVLLCAVLVFCVGAARAGERAGRVIAIGDLHGDYTAYETVMRRAGLIDETGSWSGGATILVQNGDIAGRGPNSLQIMRDLIALQPQADAAGGRIVVLVGNHEAMQMTGDLRYVHAGEWAAFADDQSVTRRDAYFEENRDAIAGAYRDDDPDLTDDEVRALFNARLPVGFVEHRAAWAPGGEIGAWVAANPAVLIVDDTLFVHGGLSRLYADFSIEDINSATQSALRAQTRDRSATVNDPFGPAWYRGLLRESDAEPIHMTGHGATTVDHEIEVVLEAFDVERIVVGHTPQTDGIAALHNARVIVIDTGMASHYGGVNAFLEITPSGVVADNDGVRSQIEAFEAHD